MQRDRFSEFFSSIILGVSYLVLSCPVFGTVRINEFMAANRDSLVNSLNESGDWLELYNDSDIAVNLGGMYLTDDTTVPQRWQIPAGTVIDSQGYLLIWADGRSVTGELHASFSLDAEGEQLALYDTDGQTLLDGVAFDKQASDISYGRSPNLATQWQYMDRPTPEAENKDGYLGLVEDTKFTVDRGFFDEPFQVQITTATPEAFILYTTDGSDPTRSSTVTVYSDPVTISTTTCLRAYAMKPTWRPTNVDTQTYLFLDDVLLLSQAQALAAGYPGTWFGSLPGDYEMDPQVTQDNAYRDQMKDALLSLPTLSLVTNKEHLFNKTKDPDTGGIYIFPGHSSTGGQDWERPVSAEFFDAQGVQEFQANCGLRIQGGESRRPQKMPKHSLSLRFRETYGPAKLDFPFFDNWPVDSFDSLQLRGFFNNTWAHWSSSQRRQATYIRDQWMRDTLTAMGQQDAGQGFYVHLYLNGMYWGLYNLEERPEEDHYAAYHGGSPDRIDAINGGSATNGTTQAWNRLKQVVRQKDWTQIQTLMDVDNFIDFMMAHIYSGNQDLKTGGNWRAAGGGIDQRPWRFYAWDCERILENPGTTSVRPSQDPTGLWDSLRQIEAFNSRFADRVHKHCFNNGALTAAATALRFDTRANEIELGILGESARWGDYRRDAHSYNNGPYYLYTRDTHWTPERNRLMTSYFPQRTEKVIQIFQGMNLYPMIEAPTFHVDGQAQHGGQMTTGQQLSMTASGSSILYTLDGKDPRDDSDISGPGQLESIVLIEEDAAKKVLVPTGDIGTAWQGGHEPFDDTTWTAGTPIKTGTSGAVGYEASSGYESFIAYDLLDDMRGSNGSCYIRIPFTVDRGDMLTLTGLTLHVRCDDGFVAYLNGTEVASINKPSSLRWNSTCSNRSDDTSFAVVPITQHADQLRTGLNILAVQAINQSTTSSDFLFSVELVGTKGDSDNPGSHGSATAQPYAAPIQLPHSTRVKARAYNGQWSALNDAVYSVGPIVESLRISELMYHPADPNTEYVELINIGSDTINLNLVRFSQGIDFTFGVTELTPGERAVIVEDVEAFRALYGQDARVIGQFEAALNNGGERIVLLDAAGAEILNFKYNDDWDKTTDGRGHSLEVIYPVSSAPTAWSDSDTWRASDLQGGTPGY